MDKAKLRIFAGAAGALFGFAGLVALSAALVVVLASAVGLALGITIVAIVYVAVACGCFYFFLLPYKSSDEEIDQFEDSTASALADLPIDTLKHFVTKHPMAAAGLAAFMGYTMINDPKAARRHMERFAISLF